jgi:hypothetical protein
MALYSSILGYIVLSCSKISYMLRQETTIEYMVSRCICGENKACAKLCVYLL